MLDQNSLTISGENVKIIDLEKFIFPNGTIQDAASDLPALGECPIWPTDVFAFSATIIEKSGCLTFRPSGTYQCQIINPVQIKKLAEDWRVSFFPPQQIKDSWKYIVKHGGVDISELKNHPDLLCNLHFLLRCSDETAEGMGWRDVAAGGSVFNLIVDLFRFGAPSIASSFLPNIPHSFCHMVPPDRAVVAPKSIASEVGYTIRSLSHNLSLLESQPKLKINWAWADPNQDRESDSNFNVLFIPYPFNIPADCIKPAVDTKLSIGAGRKYEYFNVDPKWLPSAQGKPKKIRSDAKSIYRELIKPLIDDGLKHCKHIDCIILPECAVTEEIADEIALLLLKHEVSKGLSMFVTGAIAKSDENGKPKNKALSYIFEATSMVKNGHTKHHRWKMDISQTRRYGLTAFPADVNIDWWENIDISDRQLPFYAIGQHACITVLICEDLARNDPALPAVRAIGPNIVIALLMDGPQIPARWPARYATVLADDPGSAVLSVTSAAMVDRSNRQESAGKRSVGLWKHHTGRTETLELPKGSHAFLLALGSYFDEQVTMDNRSDGGRTRRYELMGAEPLALKSTPNWL